MNISIRLRGPVAAFFCLTASGASATDLTFDFGLIGANGGAKCANECVLGTLGENTFTTAGVTVGAIGFDAQGAVEYTTQKPGAFKANGGETGLGESNTHPSPSDTDYEVTTKTWILIDNAAARAAGYRAKSLSIESMQNGEGAQVYNYAGTLTSLDFGKLTLLDTVSAPATGGVTQTVPLSGNAYVVIQAYQPRGGSAGADIVVAEETLKAAVPEPAAWAMMLLGFSALGIVARRRRALAV